MVPRTQPSAGNPVKRRSFLQSAFALSLAAQGIGCASAARPGVRARPNIVLIMTDDLGYGDVGFTGRTDYATPAIDRIAREGVILTQAYSIAPVCTPTRVGLMTGRYPARSTLGLYEPLTVQSIGLETTPPTLPRLMKDAGYHTAHVGKWHLGSGDAHNPIRHGFDEFYGFRGAAIDYASHRESETDVHDWYDGERQLVEQGYATDLLTERAVDVIARAREPFFLNLQYNAPHWPWQAPGDPPYPDTLRMAAGGSPATFAAMMRSLDDGVAAVLDALRRSGHEDDTLVVFTSDNGGERFSNMGPFRHGKMTVWEGGIRVAAAARWPAEIAAGTSTDQVASTLDWTATFLSLAGATAPAAAPPDGIDITPQLIGAAASTPREIFWRIHQRRRQKAVRSGDWKYIVDDQGEHLFELAADPGEARDRKSDSPAVLERLRSALAGWERQVLPVIDLPPEER